MKSDFRINDEVEFTVLNRKFIGYINLISSDRLIRINSLIGEYRRSPEEVTKI